MKSWQSTLVGILTAIILIATQLLNLFDGDPASVLSVEMILAALGIGTLGAVSRDNNKSSEDVGTK